MERTTRKTARREMNFRKRGAALTALLPLFLCVDQVKAENIECPSYITSAQRLVTDHPGWKSIQRESRENLGYAFLSNSAGEAIAGTESTTRAGATLTVWDMTKFSDYHVYVTCKYLGTSVILTRIVDKNYRECRFASDKNKNGISPSTFTCSY